DVSGMGASGFGWSAEERYYNTQIEILRSHDLAERVVRKMGLENDPMFAGLRDPALVLSQMVTAIPRTDTGILEISLTGADPKRITEIVNTVAEEYVLRNINQAKLNLKTLLVEMNSAVHDLSTDTQDSEVKKLQEA